MSVNWNLEAAFILKQFLNSVFPCRLQQELANVYATF